MPLLLILLLSAVVSAQNENPLFPRPALKHLSVTTGASATTARVGSRVSLFIDVVPNPGIHVYAPGAKGYQAITVKLNPSAGVAAGKPAYPRAETLLFEPLNERVPVFQRPFRIAQEITLARVPKAGTRVTVNGTLAYQACDDKVCYPPASLSVSWTLRVN